jgi:hypothetical protein
MAYSKQTWANGVGGGTPLSAARLTVMENGIEAADRHARTGTGSPEGAVTAPVGDFYTNTTTGDLYLKTSGTGSTGWVLKGAQGPPGSDGADGADGVDSGAAGFVQFSSYAGADDDAKLAAAVTAITAMTYKPSLVLDENRLYTFNNACPALPHGFHLTGPIGSVNGQPEQTANNAEQATVDINYSGVWYNPTTSKWNIRFSNIDFTGTSTTTFCNSGTATAWRWQLWNLSFDGFLGIMGTAASKFLMTACSTWGQWDVANSAGTAFHLGGSDNDLFMNGMFLDSGASVTDSTPHFWADNLQKTNIGPVYCTARLNWTGLYVSGSMTNGPGLVVHPGSRWEGQNTTTPCRGATIRVDGGALSIYGSAVNYGMSTTNARSDAGVIHHAGGDLVVREPSYARTSTVSQDVPFIYSSGGRLYVSGVQQSTYGGSSAWTDLPVVNVTSGGNLRECDSSVRVDPIKERDARVYTGASAPTNPQKGDLWIDAGAAAFQIWSGSAWGTTRVS